MRMSALVSLTIGSLLLILHSPVGNAKPDFVSGAMGLGPDSLVQSDYYEYPSTKDIEIPPWIIPAYAFFPSPDDDGTFIQVLMNEEMSGPGVPAFLPSFFKKTDVRFYLFTKNNPDKAIELHNDQDNAEVVESYFRPESPVKILCHGYMSSSTKPYPVLMKNAYLNLGEYLNVILVDWRSLSHTLYYPTAAKRTMKVGDEIGILIKRLLEENLTTLDKIHFIGHSLGAHVGGSVGYSLSTFKLGKIDRITGLDPAGPSFCSEAIKRLEPDDAQYVDVIHSDDGDYCGWLSVSMSIFSSSKGKFGSNIRFGVVDFFPNGGYDQAGCSNALWDTCNHSRSYYYMEESFNSTASAYQFNGCKCKSYKDYLSGDCLCSDSNQALMGEYAPRTANGTYFLKTGNKYPFAQV